MSSLCLILWGQSVQTSLRSVKPPLPTAPRFTSRKRSIKRVIWALSFPSRPSCPVIRADTSGYEWRRVDAGLHQIYGALHQLCIERLNRLQFLCFFWSKSYQQDTRLPHVPSHIRKASIPAWYRDLPHLVARFCKFDYWFKQFNHNFILLKPEQSWIQTGVLVGNQEYRSLCVDLSSVFAFPSSAHVSELWFCPRLNQWDSPCANVLSLSGPKSVHQSCW